MIVEEDVLRKVMEQKIAVWRAVCYNAIPGEVLPFIHWDNLMVTPEGYTTRDTDYGTHALRNLDSSTCCLDTLLKMEFQETLNEMDRVLKSMDVQEKPVSEADPSAPSLPPLDPEQQEKPMSEADNQN